jgi:hypothetical protein
MSSGRSDCDSIPLGFHFSLKIFQGNVSWHLRACEPTKNVHRVSIASFNLKALPRIFDSCRRIHRLTAQPQTFTLFHQLCIFYKRKEFMHSSLQDGYASSEGQSTSFCVVISPRGHIPSLHSSVDKRFDIFACRHRVRFARATTSTQSSILAQDDSSHVRHRPKHVHATVSRHIAGAFRVLSFVTFPFLFFVPNVRE